MVQRKDPPEHEPAAVALRRYAIHDVAYILLMCSWNQVTRAPSVGFGRCLVFPRYHLLPAMAFYTYTAMRTDKLARRNQ